MLCVFVAVGVMKWPLLWVVLVATPISVLVAWPWGKSCNKGAPNA
jgi:ABC-type bacteriocin/lantibiotic exporter with double-glycine peptidase domain